MGGINPPPTGFLGFPPRPEAGRVPYVAMWWVTLFASKARDGGPLLLCFAKGLTRPRTPFNPHRVLLLEILGCFFPRMCAFTDGPCPATPLANVEWCSSLRSFYGSWDTVAPLLFASERAVSPWMPEFHPQVPRPCPQEPSARISEGSTWQIQVEVSLYRPCSTCHAECNECTPSHGVHCSHREAAANGVARC